MVGEGGVEPDAVSSMPGNDLRNQPHTRAAKSGAVADADGLSALIDAWPGLLPETRAAVLAMVKADVEKREP